MNVYYYMFMRMTDDVETQQKGVVFVHWQGPADVHFKVPDREEDIRKCLL